MFVRKACDSVLLMLLTVSCCVFLAPSGIATDASVESASADPGTKKPLVPIPSETARRGSMGKVLEVFGDRMRKSATAEAKLALSSELAASAKETVEPCDRYVLFEAALQLAKESGDARRVIETIDQMAETFDFDLEHAQEIALTEISTAIAVPSQASVVDLLLSAATKRIESQEFEKAEDLIKSALMASRKIKDRERQKASAEQANYLREERKRVDEIRSLQKRVVTDAGDREASLLLGKHLCLTEHDWANGLPLLVRGKDSQIAKLADADLRGGNLLTQRLAVADAWANFSKSQKSELAALADARARMLYSDALTKSSGLDKARIQKCLDELIHEVSAKQKGNRPSALALWCDATAVNSVRSPDGAIPNKRTKEQFVVAKWADVFGAPTFEAVNPQRAPVLALLGSSKHAVQFKNGEILSLGKSYPAQGTLALVFASSDTGVNARIISCYAGEPGMRVATRPGGGVLFEAAKKANEEQIIIAPAASIRQNDVTILIGTWPSPFAFRVNGTEFVSPFAAKYDPSGGRSIILGGLDERGSEPFKGWVAEFRVYGKILSASEIAMLESELRRKWAVPIGK